MSSDEKVLLPEKKIFKNESKKKREEKLTCFK